MPGPIRGQINNHHSQSEACIHLDSRQSGRSTRLTSTLHSGASRGSRSEWTWVSVTRSYNRNDKRIDTDDDNDNEFCLTSEISRHEVCRVSPATGSLTQPKGSLASWMKSVSPDLGISSSHLIEIPSFCMTHMVNRSRSGGSIIQV